MAVQETNLRAVLTLIDEMSPVLKSVQKELRAASRDIQDGFEGIKDMALTAGAGDGGFWKIAAATGTARIVSAGLNYVLNRSYVFHSDQKALSRYLVLCAALAAASAAFVSALSRFVQVTPVWKVFCDTVLFFVSYRIQKIWVFAGEKSDRCADRERGKPDGAR